MTIAAASTTVDRIKNSLVALRMPRALEALDATLRRIEQGEIDGIEALDQSCSPRSSPCVRTGACAPPSPWHG